MRILLIDLDSLMSLIWHSGAYHKAQSPDYGAFFKSVRQAVEKNVDRLGPSHVMILTEDAQQSAKRLHDNEYRKSRFQVPMQGYAWFPQLRHQLNRIGAGLVVCPRCEPYDAMAHIHKTLSSNESMESSTSLMLLTSDRRCWGLVDEATSVIWHYAKDPSLTQVTPVVMQNHFGLSGDQYRQAQVLEGLPGLGSKKSTHLIREYGSLSGIGENLSLIEGHTGRILREHLKSTGRIMYRRVYPQSIRGLGVALSSMQVDYCGTAHPDDREKSQIA